MNRRAALLLVLLSMSPPVSAQQQYTGCYDIDLGAWDPPAPGADSTYFAPPARVRLSEEPGRGIFGGEHGNAVDVVPGAMTSLHRYAWWRPLDSGGIEIVWSTGFSGLTATVSRASGDTLRGTAQTFTDVARSTAHIAELTAAPVNCDAPIAPARRLRHRYPRHVRLASGDSIALGDTLPRGLDRDSGASRRFRINVDPAAPYRGAEQVEVNLGADRRIESLRLTYPAEISFETLLNRLEQELGPAEVQSARRARMAAWSARTVLILLHDRGDGTGAQVSILIPG
jgi:hypothetical protein